MNLRHIIYEENPTRAYKVAILIKDTCFNKDEIKKYYIDPLAKLGIEPKEIVVFNLEYTPSNKAPITVIKACLPNVLKACKRVNIEKLLVADPNYFKALTKVTKSEPHYGYVLPCKIPDFEAMDVVLTLNYASLFYDPTQQIKIDRSLKTLADSILSIAIEPGRDVIHSEEYPHLTTDIRRALVKLQEYPALTVDIETYSLSFHKAGLATISFAWDLHNGLAFTIDFDNTPRDKTEDIRAMLLTFFKNYNGELIYHYANYDIKILIFELFMEKDYFNTAGLLEGLEVMYKNTHCTQIITYLATNSTAGNHLSLKEISAEFAGNWAQDDIKDINKIPEPDLLRYNLVDTLSTWYAYDKNYPILVHDQQLDVYENIYRPSMKTVTQMELTGMPMDAWKIGETKDTLTDILWEYRAVLEQSPLITQFENILKLEAVITKNSKLKVKRVTVEDFAELEFNPNSNKQVGKLLHEYFELPIMDTTDTGLPAVGADSLNKQLNMLISEYNITEEDLKNGT